MESRENEAKNKAQATNSDGSTGTNPTTTDNGNTAGTNAGNPIDDKDDGERKGDNQRARAEEVNKKLESLLKAQSLLKDQSAANSVSYLTKAMKMALSSEPADPNAILEQINQEHLERKAQKEKAKKLLADMTRVCRIASSGLILAMIYWQMLVFDGRLLKNLKLLAQLLFLIGAGSWLAGDVVPRLIVALPNVRSSAWRSFTELCFFFWGMKSWPWYVWSGEAWLNVIQWAKQHLSPKGIDSEDFHIIYAFKVLAYNDRFRHLFSASVMLYALFYDLFKHNFISRIYETDKYGVVLVYASVLLFKYGLTRSKLNFHKMRHLASSIAVKKWPTLDGYREYLWHSSHSDPSREAFVTRYCENYAGKDNLQVTINCFTGLKLLAFTGIFKNNTSTQPSHQQVHVAMVVLLGFISAAQYLLEISSLPDSDKKLVKQLKKKVCYSVCYGILFQCVADLQLAGIFSADSHRLNAFVAFFEALLIEQTI